VAGTVCSLKITVSALGVINAAFAETAKVRLRAKNKAFIIIPLVSWFVGFLTGCLNQAGDFVCSFTEWL
jgi:hypothetical protein